MTTTGEICLTDACIHAASEVLWNLSPKYKEIDPCTNFEALACDGWKERHILGGADNKVSTFTVMADEAAKIVKNILETNNTGSPNLPGRDKESHQKLVGMYETCMNRTAIRAAGITPLTMVLGDLLEIFPPTDTSANKSWVAEANLYFAMLGLSTVVDMGPSADEKNPQTVIIHMSPPATVSLPAPQYYLKPDVRSSYAKAISDTLYPILSTNLSMSTPESRSMALVNFESKIAATIPPRSQLSEIDDYYTVATYNETIKLAPVLGLDKAIPALVPSKFDYINTPIIASFPGYFRNLSAIIESTPDDVLRDFFLWKAVTAFADVVDAPQVKPWKDFSAKLAGRDPDASPERWQTCVRHVKNGLVWILGRFYVNIAFNAEAQKYGEDVIENVKRQYAIRFAEATWMDDQTRARANKKLDNTLVEIGYPKLTPNTSDPESVFNFYANLTLGRSFFNNTVLLNKFSTRLSWDTLAEPANRYEWGLSPAEVNAYFNPTQNKIVFPAAIMQSPAFNPKLPSYVSYGGFGSVAGHEISHSFDDSGRKFDENGAYSGWWSNKTIEEYTKRSQCFIDQFSNFTVPDPNGGNPIHVEGGNTLGEVLGDTGGIKVSYDAWIAQRNQTKDQSLPGLSHFTHEQLFFIFFSRWWCERSTPEALVRQVLTDPHPPGKYRILGTVQNSRAFKEAFNCPVKEPQCTLW